MKKDPPSQIDVILSLLYTGERVQISFPSSSLRETFRKRLYARKAQQDEAIVALLEEPKQVLRCQNTQSFSEEEGCNIFYMIASMEPRKTTAVSFKVLSPSLEEEKEEEKEKKEEKDALKS